jgi:cytochrome c peroxidase
LSTRGIFAVAVTCTLLGACADSDVGRVTAPAPPSTTNAVIAKRPDDLDAALRSYLNQLGYTGRIASTLEARLGRPLDRRLAEVGRMLWFDPCSARHGDNACAGCHSPTDGFGDTQSIAIGIDNNGMVGVDRHGPRNQRRSPMMLNTAFYPTLMWNSRFRSLSGDPFNNGAGFQFPPPEERSLSRLPHLLAAQAFIPPTERVEVAGFEFLGDNDAIRSEVLRRLGANTAYRQLFGQVFPEVRRGAPITFEHFGRAIAEFEFTQVYADAPIDRYARGITNALSDAEKSGAVLFFGRANCVRCHQVSGSSNEMFSDFREHVIGVPQVAPSFGNVVFDGSDRNEDFGLEQVTGRAADRYGFRTSPLRNVALQPTFMHNGAFVRLEDAIRHHLDVNASARSYSPRDLATDLRGPTGPIEPVLQRLDPLLRTSLVLSDAEVADLVAFVGNGLLDANAQPARLRRLIPEKLPSGRPLFVFQFR